MKIKKTIVGIITIVLVHIWALNSFAVEIEQKDFKSVMPEASVFTLKSEPFRHYFAYEEEGGPFLGVVFLTTDVVPEKTMGYHDQIVSLVGVSVKGEITGVKILKENETSQYIRGFLSEGSWFLNQFVGKRITDQLNIGEDIDGISGATISSSAVASAIESGLDVVAGQVTLGGSEDAAPIKHLGLQQTVGKINFVFIWIIVALAFAAFFKRSKLLRYFVLALSIVYIGFLKGGGFSIGDVLNFGYLNFPDFLDNLYWYSLAVIAIGLTLFAGRFYCGWLCPFGAVLDILSQIKIVKFNLPINYHKYLKFIKYINLALILVVAFLFANKEGAYGLITVVEPFATFFRLSGDFIAWLWVVFVIVLSVFMTRFFCRYLCPLGAFFALLSKAGRVLRIKQLHIYLPLENCTGCQLAQSSCPMKAISCNDKLTRPTIEQEECLMCNTCIGVCPVESKKNSHNSKPDS